MTEKPEKQWMSVLLRLCGYIYSLTYLSTKLKYYFIRFTAVASFANSEHISRLTSVSIADSVQVNVSWVVSFYTP